jgi:hypothetical protein
MSENRRRLLQSSYWTYWRSFLVLSGFGVSVRMKGVQYFDGNPFPVIYSFLTTVRYEGDLFLKPSN